MTTHSDPVDEAAPEEADVPAGESSAAAPTATAVGPADPAADDAQPEPTATAEPADPASDDAQPAPTEATGLPAVSPAETATVPRNTRPPRRRRLIFWTAMLAALAMVAGGGFLGVTSYLAQTRPEQVVLDYFAALEQGDAATALAYGALPDGERDLLTDEVLAAQNAVAPMTVTTVDILSQTATSATAIVYYRLGFDDGDATVSDTVELVRVGRTWSLVSVAVPASVRVVNGENRATLAGADVPAGEHFLFPGALPVGFDTPYMALDTSSRVVRFTQARDLPENAGLSATGKEAVDAALDAALTACLDGTAAELTLCPLPTEARAVPGTLRGTPARPASDEATYEFTYEDGLLRISGEVTVEGEYEQLDFNNRRLTKTGDLTIDFLASCDATSPDSISWRTV